MNVRRTMGTTRRATAPQTNGDNSMTALRPERSRLERRTRAPLGFGPSKRRWFADVVAVILFLALSPTPAAAEIVYDNTHLTLGRGERIGPHPGDWFLAQPFEIGPNNAVTSFSIGLLRLGSPSGTVHFSIWDDGGGIPGQHLDDLGFVEALEVEQFFLSSLPTRLPIFTFESPVTGLLPNETYYVVLDYRNLAGGQASIQNGVGSGGPRSSAGTGGAGPLMAANPFAEPPFSARDWRSSSAIFGESRYLQMSVTAAILQPGDYNANGFVEQGDLDLVLLNWGNDGTTIPAGWELDFPEGTIDQQELDKVLLNWGNASAAVRIANVPEPNAMLLALVALIVSVASSSRLHKAACA